MKQLLSTVCFLFLTIFVFGQKKTYLTFDPSCMDRLEYRYAGQTSGMSILSYNVRLSQDNLLTLDIGAEGINLKSSQPKGTLSCGELSFTDAFVQNINTGKERLYVVRKVEKGFVVTPVGSVTKFAKSGASYDILGAGYRFSMPTNTDMTTGAENLATPGYGNFVFYQGTKNTYCKPIYTINREADEVCTVKTDYAFMPGLGFVGERTGLSEAEKKQNALFLYQVNGSDVEQYINSLCPGAAPTVVVQAPAPVVHSTQPVMDKEIEIIKAADEAWVQRSAQAAATTPKKEAAPKKIYCPEKMGEGWHIVQPGESVLAISRTYGVKMQSIVAWNKIPNPNYIEVCQKIWLMPPPQGEAIAKAPTPPKNWKPAGVKKTVKPVESMAKTTGPTTVRQWIEEAEPAAVFVQADARAQQPAVYSTPTQTTPTASMGYAETSPAPTAYSTVPAPIATEPVVYGAYFEGELSDQPGTVVTPDYTSEGTVLPASTVAITPAVVNTPPATYSAPSKTTPAVAYAAGALSTSAPRAFEVPTVTELKPEPALYAAAAPTQPTVYSTPSTFTAKSAAVGPIAPRKALVHIVQQGESLYSIARLYGYTLDRFALMNGLDYNVILRPGMELIATDCTCPNPAYQEETAPAEYGTAATGTVFEETKVYETPNTSATQTTQTTTTAARGHVTYIDLESKTTPKGAAMPSDLTPVVYSTTADHHGAATQSHTTGVLKTHTVRPGEDAYTISSLYKITLDELLSWNNISANEQLFSGKTLIVGR